MQLSDSLAGNQQKARALNGFRFQVWVSIPCMFVRSDGYGRDAFNVVLALELAATTYHSRVKSCTEIWANDFT
jgi:hypothetical protein